jgi:hypothetical protein
MRKATEELPAQPAGAANPAGLARQNRQRERALKRLRKLRIKAADEIEKLLSFLDASDEYVMTELEDDGDQNDAAFPEGGGRMGLGRFHEDDEPDSDDEPSLGSSGHGEGGPVIYLVHAISDGQEMVYDCEADEHDGREPDDDENKLQPLSLNR